MYFYFTLFVLMSFYLLLVNKFLKKFNLSLDKESNNENHKSLLREDNSTPLSGTFYFLPIIIIFFNNLDIAILICCGSLFFLGMFADLKILTSYKIRLIFQFLIISIVFYISKEIKIDTRILVIDSLMNYEITRILICSFFFMVLINGFNLIDGTNCLCSLNFLIISIFLNMSISDKSFNFLNLELNALMFALLVFLIFNFFGKNFLGDGAAYGVGFLFGYMLLKLSILNQDMSPYFIANLLFYPAFENLFSILRRKILKKNDFLPDNLHLHQIIFKYIKKKKIIKKNFICSSLIGILINSLFLLSYIIGYNNINNSKIQLILIAISSFLYLALYYFFNRKLSQ